MCGKGVWRKLDSDPNSDTYEGEYLDDKKHGFGEFKWASGGYYRGNYYNDLKTGYGEMYWQDGSIYRGNWQNGIQNGLGIMIFANGIRKAGTFQDNVLVELIMDKNDIERKEAESGVQFPQSFKQELKEYLGLMNPDENNAEYIDKKYQDARTEDKFLPNTLLQMQELAHAPWLAGGENARNEYIEMVKQQEIQQELADREPRKAKGTESKTDMATQWQDPQKDASV